MKPRVTRKSVIAMNVLPTVAGVLAALPILIVNPVLSSFFQSIADSLASSVSISKIELFGITIDQVPTSLPILVSSVLLITALLFLGQHRILELYTGTLIAKSPLSRWMRLKSFKELDRLRYEYTQVISQLGSSIDTGNPRQYRATRLMLEAKADALMRTLLDLPLHQHEIMPTKLGNVLAASSSRIVERYGMDLSLLWSRLLHLAPLAYREELENAQITLQAYVNGSFLFFLLSLLAVYTVIYASPVWLYAGIWIVIYFVASVYLYQSSIDKARDYNQLIQGGVDLYRFEMLEKMNLRLPASYPEERLLWREVSEFMLHQPDVSGHRIFSYDRDKEKSQAKERGAEEQVMPIREQVIEHSVSPVLVKMLDRLIKLALVAGLWMFVRDVLVLLLKPKVSFQGERSSDV